MSERMDFSLCPLTDEDINRACRLCGATPGRDDPVRGVCQGPEIKKSCTKMMLDEHSRLRAENERLRGIFRDRLTKGGWTCAFLDGRNEHGCWVLSLSPSNLTIEAEKQLWEDMDDQDTEFAENVMKSAESHGFEAGMCVVLNVYFEDNGTAYDPQFDEELTVLFYGTPDEQRAAIAALGEDQ